MCTAVLALALVVTLARPCKVPPTSDIGSSAVGSGTSLHVAFAGGTSRPTSEPWSHRTFPRQFRGELSVHRGTNVSDTSARFVLYSLGLTITKNNIVRDVGIVLCCALCLILLLSTMAWCASDMERTEQGAHELPHGLLARDFDMDDAQRFAYARAPREEGNINLEG